MSVPPIFPDNSLRMHCAPASLTFAQTLEDLQTCQPKGLTFCLEPFSGLLTCLCLILQVSLKITSSGKPSLNSHTE